MKKIVLSLALVMILISGCNQGAPAANTNSHETSGSNTHKSLLEDKNIIQTTTAIHDDPQYLVYFTQDGCPNCEKTNPIVEKFADENKDYKVYMVDIKTGDANSKDDWYNLPFSKSENADPALPTAVTDDISIKYTPTLLVVRNGEIVNMGIGYGDKPANVNVMLEELIKKQG